MRTFTRIVSPTEISSDQIKQPGMNRTCIRLPGRFDMKTIRVREYAR